MSTLYIVATPIGNLEDITLRALRILKDVDLVLCEDTRVTGKLLEHYEIDTPTMSYHQHSGSLKVQKVVATLEEGKDVALVSDAGTPGVSDPGNKLVADVLKKISDVEVVPVPGVSAVTAAASIAGLSTDEFVFLGFLPHKKGRQKMVQEIADSVRTVIFYESKHRILKALEQLRDALEDTRQVVVCRELTKMHESVYRGSVSEVLDQLQSGSGKGEFVVMVSGA